AASTALRPARAGPAVRAIRALPEARKAASTARRPAVATSMAAVTVAAASTARLPAVHLRGAASTGPRGTPGPVPTRAAADMTAGPGTPTGTRLRLPAVTTRPANTQAVNFRAGNMTPDRRMTVVTTTHRRTAVFTGARPIATGPTTTA